MPIVVGPDDGTEVMPSQLTSVSVCSPWTTVEQVKGVNKHVLDVDDETITAAILWASDLLFSLSGRQWAGSCEDTVRPYGSRPYTGSDYRNLQEPMSYEVSGSRPFLGAQFNVSEITLGVYPLTSIIEVKQDGVVVDPAEYRIDNKRALVRLPDSAGNRVDWHYWQDMRLPTDKPGTMEVTFTYGHAPPPGGELSAAILAAELSLSLNGDKACRLPSRATQVARQGVTIIMYPVDQIAKGNTGIVEVDMWLASVNPKRIRARATFASPDRRAAVRRTN